MRLMTYNVENLFDTKNDTLTDDDDFLPESERHWTIKRYDKKVADIARVIVALGEWSPPMIVGLCEVEDDYVMKSLAYYSPLKQLGYDYIHYESPDERGIDVGLLYRRDLFTPLISKPIPVKLGGNDFSRDILYVCGSLESGELIHLFQTHFPSRREGELESEEKRIKAAEILRREVDSIFALDPSAAVVIMGDFNDMPDNSALTDTLHANFVEKDTVYESGQLYNLTSVLQRKGMGSYNFRGVWQMLDQIIVSGSLLNGALSISVSPDGAAVFGEPWMLEENDAYLDFVPKRTYKGYKYNSGYSDHLPVYVDINTK